MASDDREVAARPSAQEGNIRGPPCDHCMINLGVPVRLVRDRLTGPERDYMHAHYRTYRRICHRCLHSIMYKRRMRWWIFVFHGHLILDDPFLAPRITQYLWRSVRFQQCRCGYCDPTWFLRGGRCWGTKPINLDKDFVQDESIEPLWPIHGGNPECMG